MHYLNDIAHDILYYIHIINKCNIHILDEHWLIPLTTIIKRNNNIFKTIKFFFAQYTLENKYSILCVQNRLKRNYEDELFKNHIISSKVHITSNTFSWNWHTIRINLFDFSNKFT